MNFASMLLPSVKKGGADGFGGVDDFASCFMNGDLFSPPQPQKAEADDKAAAAESGLPAGQQLVF